MKTDIEKFFDDYQLRFERGLRGDEVTDDTVAAFADYFVESNSAGVMGGANDEAFKELVPKGYEKYRSIGTLSMKIGSLETTPIDDLHSMTRVHWISRYDLNGKEKVIEFDVIYFLRLLDNNIKVFAYITGDEQKILQENGLI